MECPVCRSAMSRTDRECPICKLPNVSRILTPEGRADSPIYGAEQSCTTSLPSTQPGSCSRCGGRLAPGTSYCSACRTEHGGTTRLPRPQRTRRTKIFLVPAILLALLLLSGGGYYYWTTTPQYSLLQAKNAIATHDVGAFEKYVDVDSITNGFIDDAFGQVADGARGLVGQQGSSFFGHTAEQVAQGLVNLLKPTVAAAIKVRARDYIEHGNAPIENPGVNPAFPGQNLEQKARDGGFTFDSVQYVNRDGSAALIGLKFLNQKDPAKTLTVELKMRQVEDHWQVVRWNNVAEVFRELGLGEGSALKQSLSGLIPTGAPATAGQGSL